MNDRARASQRANRQRPRPPAHRMHDPAPGMTRKRVSTGNWAKYCGGCTDHEVATPGGVAPASSHTIDGTIRRGACEVNWHRDRWLRGEADRARRYRRRRGDTRALIAVVLLLGLIGFYAYRSWTSKPPEPLTGQARVLDGDSIEISGARIRLQGIDAPEWSRPASMPAGRHGPAARPRRRSSGATSARAT